MAASKTEDRLRKQKEAKQKKILFALLPVLLILLVWQGPKTVGAFTGGDSPAEAVPAPTSATTTGTAPDPASGAAPSTAAPPPSTATQSAGALPNTNAQVEAGTGQLVTFDRFVGKDPFKQQVIQDADDGGGDGGGNKPGDDGGSGGGFGGGTPGGPGGTSPPPGGGDPGGDQPSGPTSATLSVNGSQQLVPVGGTFPKSDPVFRLASVASTSVRIGLVSGSFSSGVDTIKIAVGKSVTLVSQPDGTRYTIKLLRVS